MTPAATRDPRLGMGKPTQERLETREIGQMSVRASIRPESLNDDARTVEVTWSTGARVLRGFGSDKWYEELSMDPAHVRMDRLSSGNAPVLDAHSSWSSHYVHGVVENARIENGAGFATLRFSDDPDSDLIFQKIRSKILCSVSVGYAIHRLELVEESDGDIPVYRATDWTPAEISVVPIPADPDATVRSGERTHPCVFVTRAADQEPVTMAKETKTPEVEPKAPEQRSAPVVDEAAIRAEGALAEQSRIASITRTGGVMSLDNAFVAKHVKANTPADEFRALAEDEYDRAKPPVSDDASRAPSITAGDDARDKWLRGAGDWLIVRSAGVDVMTQAAEERGEALTIDPGEFRGLTMLDLARSALELVGINTRGMSKMDIVGDALTGRGGYQAVGDFSVLLENALHKRLQAQFAITEDTWRNFCAIGSVSDFRAHPRYRTASLGVLPVVPEGAEFKNQSQPDGEKESITAGTRGTIVQITRQALINDDMGALSSTANNLGRAAALTLEAAFYTSLALNSGLGPLLNDAVAMFDATHNNLGGGAALSSVAIDADSAVMEAQTLPGSQDIASIKPAVLLIARALKSTAITINESKFDPDTADSNKPNTTNGMFKTIIATTRITGTRRYLFADPRDAPVFEMAFLDGQQNPFLENERGFRRDGVSFKARLDFGIAGVGERGAVTDAGS